MAKIFKQSEAVSVFLCPGCNEPHGITSTLGFDGNLDKPTLDRPLEFEGTHRCFSIISDGKISFTKGSTHDLAGKTQALPDWPFIDAYGTLPEADQAEADSGA